MFLIRIFVLILAFHLQACKTTPSLSKQKNIGGVPETNAEYLASLIATVKGKPSVKCGGSFIEPDVVLTAAHCVHNRNYKVKVFKGAGSLVDSKKSFEINAIWIHEKYDPITYNHDIALIFLKPNKLLGFSDRENNTIAYATTLALPDPGKTVKFLGRGEMVSHGSFSTGETHSVELDVLDYKKCEKMIKGQSHNWQLCLGKTNKGGVDTCQGDSGAPGIQFDVRDGVLNPPAKAVQTAIVSHGIGCATPGIGGVYVKVGYYTGWIRESIKSYREDQIVTDFASAPSTIDHFCIDKTLTLKKLEGAEGKIYVSKLTIPHLYGLKPPFKKVESVKGQKVCEFTVNTKRDGNQKAILYADNLSSDTYDLYFEVGKKKFQKSMPSKRYEGIFCGDNYAILDELDGAVNLNINGLGFKEWDNYTGENQALKENEIVSSLGACQYGDKSFRVDQYQNGGYYLDYNGEYGRRVIQVKILSNPFFLYYNKPTNSKKTKVIVNNNSDKHIFGWAIHCEDLRILRIIGENKDEVSIKNTNGVDYYFFHPNRSIGGIPPGGSHSLEMEISNQGNSNLKCLVNDLEAPAEEINDEMFREILEDL